MRNRIPRKKKKFYKTLWFKRSLVKRFIVKSSIKYNSDTNIWGCITKDQN